MSSTSDPTTRAEVLRIADQLRRAVEGANWSGPNLRSLIDSVTPEVALARPFAGAHTIGELVAHTAVWMEVPVRRFLQGEAYDPPPALDWPAVEGEAGWAAAQARLDAAYGALLAALDTLTDDQLGEGTPGKSYTTYVLLHGVVQHTLYHAGQIALLRNAVAAG
ncbi:MAG TPA: DinB family protein [Rhodothermales bacterium]|nr:DinB family protein [Rhodothermales bacterium]